MWRISLIKKSAAIAATALTALALTACGNASTQDAGSTGSSDAAYKIGVLQLTEHTALDAANKGFVKALDGRYRFVCHPGQPRGRPRTTSLRARPCASKAGGRWRRRSSPSRPRRAGGR